MIILNDIDGRIDAIFFALKKSIIESHEIGEVVGIDSTYKVSQEDFPLLIFVCVNKYYLTRVLAMCFMRKEEFGYYEFAIKSYLSTGFREPETIFCDQHPSQILAIEKVLTTTKIKYCTMHIQRNITSRIGALLSIERK
jgi:hypothetical protein